MIKLKVGMKLKSTLLPHITLTVKEILPVGIVVETDHKTPKRFCWPKEWIHLDCTPEEP